MRWNEMKTSFRFNRLSVLGEEEGGGPAVAEDWEDAGGG